MTPLEIDKIINELGAQQHALNQEIHHTPTGPVRVALCNANLHISMALRDLRVIRDNYSYEDPTTLRQVQA